MVSIETIREQFDELGIEPSDEIINKSIEICINNDINDPVEFVEQWMAYSVSKLGGAEPTVAFLNEMEAHEYTSKSSRKAKVSSLAGVPLGNVASPRLDTKVAKITTYRNVDSTEQDVLEMYGCITPKTKKSTSYLQQNKNTPECIRGGSAFTTVTYSPLSTSLKKVAPDAPSKSGQVVYTYGNAQLLKQINWLPSGASDDADAKTESEKRTKESAGNERHHRAGGVSVSFKAEKFANDSSKYMFDSSYDRVMILSDRIYETGNAICRRLVEETDAKRENTTDADSAGLGASSNSSTSKTVEEGDEENGQVQVNHEDDTTSSWFDGVKVCHVDYPSSEPIRVLGRIVADEPAAGGEAPQKSTTNRLLSIVDFDENTLRWTRLDLSKIVTPGWSLFPGQTVLLEGINPRGTLFTVQRIHHERILTLPRTPIGLERPITMVIASAPFTDRDDLLYEKLSGLLQYCTSDPPDVLLLTGPFADASCSLYADVAEPFEEYFEKIIATIMGAVGGRTEVCIVANHDDLVGSFVYPTLPYKVGSFYKNLHLLPDPCVINVGEGLEVGVTTVDIIKQLMDAECTAAGGGSDKIKRAYNHLFHQATFYPLNPPPEDVPLDVDMLNEYGRLNRVPNIMVCPSALNRYVREINRCVCINPGFVDGHSIEGGSYARLIIHPPDTSSEPQDNKVSTTTSSQHQPLPTSYIGCQIIKT
ncbi:DNA polymerase alpha subunit B [Anopheles ziemanni]|uniref:DNA polymerase alpha subunit B n=1 Tax=Anopheles coustani TaxID=139045 RepID=UPI0026595BF5|nr:DNA polymerase alpha subunit B [Anopheles coustani]XP_058171738.1 DNA polymerase alpha subunit B [Anopheles ziemanni]